MFESWRGVVGDIKPTYRPGSLEDFIRLLPEGIGVIPLTVGIRSGTEQEFRSAGAGDLQPGHETLGRAKAFPRARAREGLWPATGGVAIEACWSVGVVEY